MLLQWRFDHDPSNARGSAARTMIRTPSSGGRAGRHSKRKSGNGGLSNIGIGLRLTSGSRRVGSGTPGGSISISGSGIVSGTGLDGHGIRIDRFLLVLRLAWSLVVVYGEVVMFSSAVSRCKWPNKFGYDVGALIIMFCNGSCCRCSSQDQEASHSTSSSSLTLSVAHVPDTHPILTFATASTRLAV